MALGITLLLPASAGKGRFVMSLGLWISIGMIVVGLAFKVWFYLEDVYAERVAKAFEDLKEERRLEKQREKYNLKERR